MLYRALRWINQRYALTVFWLFLALFLLACSLIFIFPLGPILLVFLGLGGLGAAVVVGRSLRSVEAALARRALRRGVCPHCGDAGHGQNEGEAWHCPRCGLKLDSKGRELQEAEAAAAAEHE